MQSPEMIFAEELFSAHRRPVNTHEEWLLRLCSQLMHREATVVSVMEKNARPRGLHDDPCTTSSNAPDPSGSASMETDAAPSSEC